MQALTYQPYYNPTDSQPELQRQLEYFPRQPRKRTLTWQITLSYPSPPMSSSPSPLRKLSDVPSTNTTSAVSLLATAVSSISASGTSAISLPPTPSNIAQATPSGSQPLPLPIEPVVSTAALPPLATRKPSSSGQGDVPLADTQSVSSVGVAPDAQTTAGPAPLASLSTAAAGGRRSKAHVANACSNCKRAHLSCDVDRPCNRCIQTGKTDSCKDVPHKKRGRPRLRDEGELRVHQQLEGNRQITEPAIAGPSTASSRGVPGARHRRMGSLRTLRSFPETPVTGFSLMAPPPQSLAPAFVPSPRLPFATQGSRIPIVFLTLDLVIMKTNIAFQQLFAEIKDFDGIHISEIASPLKGDSFQDTRNRLREEREAKDPSYLPPILQPSLNPVSGITDNDVESVSRGFDDQRFVWSFRFAGGVEQTLSVRLRLAKTSMYFVILFLPPPPQPQVEQVPLPPPRPPPGAYAMPSAPIPTSPFQSSPSQMGEPSFHGREGGPRSSPRLHMYPPQAGYAGPFAQPGDPSPVFSPRTYSPLESQQPRYVYPPGQMQYQQPPYITYQPLPPGPSRQSILEQPQTARSTSASASVGSVHSPFVSSFPVTRPRSDTMDSLGRHIQTRFRADSGVTQSSVVQASPQRPTRRISRTSSDDSPGPAAAAQRQSPRKRRRMNLDNVLHRQE